MNQSRTSDEEKIDQISRLILKDEGPSTGKEKAKTGRPGPEKKKYRETKRGTAGGYLCFFMSGAYNKTYLTGLYLTPQRMDPPKTNMYGVFCTIVCPMELQDHDLSSRLCNPEIPRPIAMR